MPISRSKSFSRQRNCPTYFRDGRRADRLRIRVGQDQSRTRRAAAIHVHEGSPGVVGPHHHGTMHIGPSLDYLERAYDDAKYGRPSERPILEITMPTSVDRTIAPPGKHILSMFVQYAPYKLLEDQA